MSSFLIASSDVSIGSQAPYHVALGRWSSCNEASCGVWRILHERALGFSSMLVSDAGWFVADECICPAYAFIGLPRQQPDLESGGSLEIDCTTKWGMVSGQCRSLEAPVPSNFVCIPTYESLERSL